ncbi:MAG: hypothetical protein GY715_14500 [Planctomycetes bacterium]|nr:hypothetical protein [Planctomycetota bacterium]
MRSASSMFTSEDRRRIAGAVSEAETRTAAEIVPVVATASDRYDRAEDLAGLVLALVATGGVWALFQGEDPLRGGWDELSLRLPFFAIVLTAIAGFVVGALLAMRIAPLRRLFTTRRHRERAVDERAAQLFFDRRIHHAPTECGVLIYVSLFERRAAVLADRTVFGVLDQARVDELCVWLTGDLKRGDVTGSLMTIIQRIGAALAEELPRREGDENELSDALITID